MHVLFSFSDLPLYPKAFIVLTCKIECIVLNNIIIVSFVQLRPENAEEFIEYLIRIGRLDEAAVKLADIVNDVGHSLSFSS